MHELWIFSTTLRTAYVELRFWLSYNNFSKPQLRLSCVTYMKFIPFLRHIKMLESWCSIGGNFRNASKGWMRHHSYWVIFELIWILKTKNALLMRSFSYWSPAWSDVNFWKLGAALYILTFVCCQNLLVCTCPNFWRLRAFCWCFCFSGTTKYLLPSPALQVQHSPLVASLRLSYRFFWLLFWYICFLLSLYKYSCRILQRC